MSPVIKKKLAAIEKELDSVWPRWRDKPSILELPANYQARIKWLLHRRPLLLHVTAGIPTPRDWPVKIHQTHGIVSGRQVTLAQVIVPDVGPNEFSPELLAGPPKVDADESVTGISASVLAARIRVPLKTVEDLLPHVPDGEEAGDWIKKQHLAAARRAREKLKAATQ